jgi:glycosyltransferase involved in cell wall biosynthesis
LLPPGKPSSVVNGSGIDCDVFAVAPLPDKPAFLIIGRLLGNKGIREFAAASRQFIAQNPGVPVRLVGYRDESADSISQAELDSMIADGIEFVGKLSDVRPEIARASVFVLPSYREGIPRSVLEAMAMGRAIIATDVPGCRQTVTDGDNGLLIPARDSGALASAMQRLVDEPALIAKMGRRSREIAETRYDVHRVNDAIMAIVGL